MATDYVGSAKPLKGIRVVEMGSSIAGPYGAWVFSELGAEVIKVEDPTGGDATRNWGPKNAHGNSAVFEALNNGKKSIVVDLKSEADVNALRTFIINSVDVVMQNLRPGFTDKIGLGQQDLIAAKPSLIYCDLGAYGKGGELSFLPGYDPLMQGFTGIAQGTGTEHGPSRVCAPVTDLLTGIWAVMGALSALLVRKDTGKGSAIDVSLMESGIALMTLYIAGFQSTGERPERKGLQGPLIAPNGGFETKDGLLMIVCGTNSLFSKLCLAMDAAELLDDERFAAGPVRFANRAELRIALEGYLRNKTRAEWLTILSQAGVPASPVNHVDEMMEEAQAQSVDILRTLNGSVDPFQTARLPIRFNGQRAEYEATAPALGEHTESLLRARHGRTGL